MGLLGKAGTLLSSVSIVYKYSALGTYLLLEARGEGAAPSAIFRLMLVSQCLR